MEPRTWIVTGRATLSDKTQGVRLQMLNADGTLGEPCHFSGARAKRLLVACVYEIPTEEDGDKLTLQIGNARFLRSYPDQEQAGVWRTEARAYEVERRARAEAKKEGTRQHLRESLAPLRKRYVSTDYIGRLALEVVVLDFLRTGGREL